MSNITSISDQVPFIPVSIQSKRGINGTIQNFVNDFTILPPFVFNTKISFLNDTANPTQFYESGLTIGYEEDGSVIVMNNGDISIDSPISFLPPNDVGNFTIVSSAGNISINQNVTAEGRITLIAPQGTVTIASNTTLNSQHDRIIISAGAIQNQGAITSVFDIILSSPENNITNSDGATIQANRIIAQHINGNHSDLSGDRIIADDFSPAQGAGTGTLLLSNANLDSTGLSNTPNSQGIFINNNGTVTVVTQQNIKIPAALTLSTDLEIVSTGAVSINNTLTMPGGNLTIIANTIKATSDINVGNNLMSDPPIIGSINLFALANISTENLIADIICDGSPGQDISDQTGFPGQDGTGKGGNFGGIGRQGHSAFAPFSPLIGTPITVISGGQISIANISAILSAQGGRGGNVIGCTGGQGGQGAGGGGGECSFWHGDIGNPGNTGGGGGIGGTGGFGGNGAPFACNGSHITLLASQAISVAQDISLTVNTSGGKGGDVINCTGGVGGAGGQGGWGISGGQGGNGGDAGSGGKGGDASNMGGQIGSVTILSCSSVAVNSLECNSINIGGNGGSVSGSGGQGGSGGLGGGACPLRAGFGDYFSGGQGGHGGSGGSAGKSGSGGNTTNPLSPATSIVTAGGTIQISHIVQNQFIAGTSETITSTPGSLGGGGTPSGPSGNTGSGPQNGSNGTMSGTPSSIPLVLVSYSNINVPDLINGTSNNVPFFQSLIGLAGSGSVTLGADHAQLQPIPAAALLNQEFPIAYAAQNTLDGTVTVVFPEQTSQLPSLPTSFAPTATSDYQVFNAVTLSNLDLALTQNVRTENMQITSFNPPKYMCPGAPSDVTFTINAQNISGTAVATLSFNSQSQTINITSDTPQIFSITAPMVTGNYPIILTVFDSFFPFCSDVVSDEINVIGMAFSDIAVPISVLAGSNFTVSFGTNVQDSTTQSPVYQASVTFNGLSSDLGQFSDSQTASKTLTAPCFPSDYILQITTKNPNISNCPIFSDFIITVIPLTVEPEVSSRSIVAGESVTLSVSDALPNVTYTWSGPNTSGSAGAVQTVVSPSGTTTYTIQAQSGSCSPVSEQISVSASSIKFSDHGSRSRTVIASSDFTISFYTVIQGGGAPSDAFANFNGSDYSLGASDFYSYTFLAPCTPSDYNLILTIQDTIGAEAHLGFKIIVKPFIVKAAVSPEPPIEPLQQITLSASTNPLLPDATYSWTSNTGATIQNHDTSVATSSPEFSTIYTVTVTNGTCSFSDSVSVRVRCAIELSDLVVAPNPILAGSPIVATFTPIILNGSGIGTATVLLSIGNNSDVFVVSDNSQASVSIHAPCVTSSGPQLLSIKAYDSGNSDCRTSSDIRIDVTQLTVKGLTSPRLIGPQTPFVTLSVSDLQSDVTYTWFGPNGIIPELSPNVFTRNATYVVKAVNGPCVASDSVIVAISNVTIPFFNTPQKMCAGSTTDISFQIQAENGTGRAQTILSFSDQIVQISDVSTTWTLFFGSAGPGNSTAGIYAANFVPLHDGPKDIQFMEVATISSAAINSMYIDTINQKIYWVNPNNELSVGSINPANPGNNGVGPQQPITTTLNVVLNNAYGLFVDSINSKMYWVNSNTNEIYVASIDNVSTPSALSNPSLLLSGSNNGLNQPSGFFLDTSTRHAYWTNLGDNSLGVGTLDSLSNPTQIQNPQLLSSDNLNQPRGISINPEDGTIYWINSANGGEFWKATIFASLNKPLQLTNPVLLSQGNFGTPTNPNTLLSGLFILFPPSSYSSSITAPSVGGTYPLTLTVNDSDLSSNSVTFLISVSNVVLSGFSSPSTVLTGSPIDVTVTPTINNDSGNSKAKVTLSIDSTSSAFTVSDGQSTTLSIPAPCFTSDTVKQLTVMVQDPNNLNCSVTSDVQITIQSLKTQILTYVISDSLTLPTNNIISGEQIILSIVDPQLPADAYEWNTGAKGFVISDRPETVTIPSEDFNYVVTTVNGNCFQNTSTIITVNAQQTCVQLSDVTLSKQQKQNGSFSLVVKGYQFVSNTSLAQSRTIKLDYGGTHDSDTFETDGQFSFSTPLIVAGFRTLTLTASVNNGNPVCIPNQLSYSFESTIFNTSGTILLNFSGSLLSLALYLPPDLTETIHTSDIDLIFSDLCAFASQKHCRRFVAGFEVLEHSDVFPSGAEILNKHHMAYIFCSDGSLYVQEIFGAFTFIVDMFVSDSVMIRHSESSFSTTKFMQRTGHEFRFFDDKIFWSSPCDSDVPFVNFQDIIDLPLLSVDAEFTPVTQIDSVACIPVCETLTSDAQYVCRLCKCAQKMDGYLTQHYSNYPDLHPDHCRITYTGNLIANTISIDLDHCLICFSDFLIPDCSDSICF